MKLEWWPQADNAVLRIGDKKLERGDTWEVSKEDADEFGLLLDPNIRRADGGPEPEETTQHAQSPHSGTAATEKGA